MIMENFPWLLPAWLIGVPFVLAVIELIRINGLVRKVHAGPDRGAVAHDSPSRYRTERLADRGLRR